MEGVSWPSQEELDRVRKVVAEMAGRNSKEVRVVVSPYRICPLGAHIDHQGGVVSAVTVNKGILLGFIPSGDSQVLLQSGQFKGEVRFRVDEIQHPRHSALKNDKIITNGSSKSKEECDWGRYARGALYALQSRENHLSQGSSMAPRDLTVQALALLLLCGRNIRFINDWKVVGALVSPKGITKNS
uniref:Uncharacterized protein n=1 Tax=Vitis vinifera TaxID=29760 RepID=F6I6Q2_VITVI